VESLHDFQEERLRKKAEVYFDSLQSRSALHGVCVVCKHPNFSRRQYINTLWGRKNLTYAEANL